MGQNSITMFTNDSGSAAGPNAYVQDVFSDTTDTPNTNSGFSSTVSTNPLNNLYGNDDFPRFGPKTLWIKDLVLLADRSLWINGEPTYQIVWHENYPSAQGYVFGNVQLFRQGRQTVVKVKSQGDGFGVGGVFARVMFLMAGNASGSATATVAVDGVANTTVPDWSTLGPGNLGNTPFYGAFVHAPANETYNIHDFRLTANQAGGVFTIAGVIVYSENSTLSIDQFPGISYNNKTQSKTTVNSTLPLPSFGNSLGGKSVIWKNASAGYSMSTIGISTITSIAQGNNNTNILNLTTGTGQFFSVGQGIISASNSGASAYVGIIQNISTDALTVSPSLVFGVSNTIYRYFNGGPSLTINPSFSILAYTFGSTEFITSGFTSPYLDPFQRFAVWGSNIGASFMDGTNPALCFGGASGFIQCEGYFSAAEIEYVGMSFSVLSGTMAINGLMAYNFNNVGFTGISKRSVFTDAGPGWNSFAFYPGSSFTNVAINRIHLYHRRRDFSASYGILAQFDTLQAFVQRANNATFIAPGMFKRTFADQLLIKGASVTRLIGATFPGGIAYACGQSSTVAFQYYGNQFSVVGGASAGFGASLNLSLDAGLNQGSTAMNTVFSGTSTAFHSVSLAVLGGTLIIGAIDFFRPVGEFTNLQTFSPLTSAIGSSISLQQLYQETRYIASKYYVNNGTTTVAGFPINFDTPVFDNTNAVTTGSTTWKFTAPSRGYYALHVNVTANPNTLSYRVYKNGNPDTYLFYGIANSQIGGGSTVQECEAGDYLDVRPDTTTVTSGIVGGAPTCTVSIERIPGG